ncbi:hypothetical protein LSTR_LSTR009956 [Laodelphax striatellus]|uniref:Protein inturned n=1 Tax=Laodelphax striatellus TaxID=195883 RepID=A0A482XGN4_LAOST|nr:hypothetical protein LSTR_LSTR009956 [Laodelphax striatellus]
MEDYGENQALLIPDSNERLRYPRIQNTRDLSDSDDESCQSDEWWDGTGSSSCSSCESELGSEADWESKVDERGELLYIESTFPSVPDNVPSTSNNINNRDTDANAATEGAKKTSTRGKLVRLIRRRSSRRSMKRKPPDNNDKEKPATGTSAKVTFRDSQEGEVRTVKLRVSNDNMGRRATLCESVLGIIASTFTDGSRIMVAGFVPNSEAMKHRSIKIGDWLRSINGQEVTIQTIDSCLRPIRPSNEIELKLQKVAACDITAHVTSSFTDDNSTSEDVYQSDLVQRLFRCHNQLVSSKEDACALSIVYLTHEGLTEDGPADQGVVYCWPPQQVNDLFDLRGAFITLHHLLIDLSHSPPISTSIVRKGSLTHIIYTPEESELLLLGIPHEKCSLPEASQLSADIVRCLKFKYQTLSRCFGNKDHRPALEQLFSSIWLQLDNSDSSTCSQFEHRFPAAHYVSLPRDAQIQIDDALSEFEANDFGSYTEDHHGSQRLYSIIGSCFFYKGYLMGSHLPSADLVDVAAFCRQMSLLSLTRLEALRSLVVWREVYPLSCNRGLPSSPSTTAPASAYHLPQGRWFMLIVGQGNSLLVTLLESAGCTIKAVGNPGPDLDYVQQAQATLKHLHKIGLPLFAEKWISNCVRPQVIAPDSPTKVSPKRSSYDNSQPSKAADSPPNKSLNTSNSSSNSKKLQEITSILKHRGSPNESTTAFSSGVSQQQQQYETSEESSVLSGGGGGDEVAPVVGRRAERERAASASDTNSQSRRSDDSDLSDPDSDWAPYMDHRRMYGSRAIDLVDLGKTLLSDVNYTLPSFLLAGMQNTLFHYVQLDFTEGLVLSPPVEREMTSSSLLFRQILNRFRSCALQIHTLLQNTVNFKRLKVQEIHESHINKSLVAIKEHGVLFETGSLETDAKKTPAPVCFWVVGRLFFAPHPKEIYVCYQESAPQNMVEIAFRLALSASG